jgi:hypothetical protein
MGLPSKWHGGPFSKDAYAYHQRKGKNRDQVAEQEVAGGRKKMNIKHVVLNLSPEETMWLTRILLDEDKDEALTFLKECLKSQLAGATRDH